jgi:hypothetical protein
MRCNGCVVRSSRIRGASGAAARVKSGIPSSLESATSDARRPEEARAAVSSTRKEGSVPGRADGEDVVLGVELAVGA